jgi:hypothetical protein
MMLRTKDYVRVLAARANGSPQHARPDAKISINFRATPEEFIRLRDQAKAASLSVSEFIRVLTCK